MRTTPRRAAFGLVVNRPMTEPAWQLVQTDPPVRVDPDLRLWIADRSIRSAWVLMSESQGPDEGQREICPGVLLSVSHQVTLQGAPGILLPLGSGYSSGIQDGRLGSSTRSLRIRLADGPTSSRR